MKKFFRFRTGLTLIEIVIVFALLTILITIVLLRSNILGDFGKARNTQRELHLQGVMNAIRQNMADNASSTFVCSSGPLPASSTRMASGGGYDIAPCIIPTYLLSMPFDPNVSGAHYASVTDYDSGYYISRNATSGHITLTAPAAELGESISLTR